MSYKVQIARIALTAAGMRNTKGLRVDLLIQTNAAVRKLLIERVGADTLLTTFDELAMEILILNLQQEILAEEGMDLPQWLIDDELDTALIVFEWDLERAFSMTIPLTEYEPRRKIVLCVPRKI